MLSRTKLVIRARVAVITGRPHRQQHANAALPGHTIGAALARLSHTLDALPSYTEPKLTMV